MFEHILFNSIVSVSWHDDSEHTRPADPHINLLDRNLFNTGIEVMWVHAYNVWVGEQPGLHRANSNAYVNWKWGILISKDSKIQ